MTILQRQLWPLNNMFLKMVHPHFVYSFTIIIALNLNTTLSLKVKKSYMCQLARVAITG